MSKRPSRCRSRRRRSSLSGLAYALLRSVRGLPWTVERCGYGRLWGGQPIDLWKLHAADGIAADGAPTGIEHAFTSAFGVVVLRPFWTDREGARRFGAAVERDGVAAALTTRIVPMSDRGYAGAWVVDLDAVYGAGDHVARIADTRVMVRSTLARMPWSGFDPPKRPQPRQAPDGEVERRLAGAVLAAPHDPEPAAVYADWLEQTGRLDDAAALRPTVRVADPVPPAPAPPPVYERGPLATSFVPDPPRCDLCGGGFSSWRYRCGLHVACTDCAISHAHRCPRCQHVFIGKPASPS